MMNNYRWLAFFALLLYESVGASDVAKKLYDDLMYKYDKRVRPVSNATEILKVAISLSLSQLIDVDEKNQIMTTNVWLKHEWTDYRLKWDPALYDQICVMYIPSEQLWLPDIALYNNADGKYQVTLKSKKDQLKVFPRFRRAIILAKATIYPSGAIVWDPPMIYKSSCPINVQYFPFDEQICSLKFGSWTHHGNQVNLTHIVYRSNEMARYDETSRSQGVFFRDYYPNGERDIIRAPAIRNQKRYSCCLQPYYDITYDLVLKRKTLFYTVHLIIPCVGISFLTFVVFYLPSQSGEKVVLCISIELALTVIFPLLADWIPSTSIMIPLLGKYLLFIMILVALSIINTTVILAFYHRAHIHHKPMSRWMKYLFVQVLPPFLLLSSRIQNEPVEEMHSESNKYPNELPDDHTLDGIFLRMLGKLLHLRDVEQIFSKFDAAVKKEKNAQDWQHVTLIFDRILFIIFTTVSLTGTLIILAQRTRQDAVSIDLNNLDQGVYNACNYTH